MYDALVESLPIEQGDRIWLSSELLKLVFLFKRRGERFDASRLLDAFQKRLGTDGTLFLPTFCFDFSNHQRYDYRKSKGTAGALGNLALERGDFVRTQHPMHSFAVWGKDRDMLVSMTNRHAFGSDSPFGYCRDHNVKQIILGTDYVHALTFVHYVETMCQVPYRFNKTFTGTYITEDGEEEIRSYDYAARKLEICPEERFNRIGVILEQNGAACRYQYYDYGSIWVDLAASYDWIREDIVKNQCRNIYDFNIPREQIFAE